MNSINSSAGKKNSLTIFRKRLLVLILFLTAAAAFGMRMVYVNHRYPAPVVYSAKPGETLEYEGISYQLTDGKIMDAQELKEKEPEVYLEKKDMIDGLESMALYSWRYVCAKFIIENHTDKEIDLTGKFCYAECGAYANGGMLLDTGGENLILAAGESKEVTFFSNLSNNFGFFNSDNVKNTRIILSVYPDQYEFRLE